MKDIVLFEKKKDKYPSKTTLNLYYQDEKSAGISTFTLYLIFIIVVLVALSKMFVFDLVGELNTAKKTYEQNQSILASYQSALERYDDVNAEYNRFSYSYLSDQEKIQDRMDVLAMLESTVFAKSSVQSVSISGSLISVSLTDIGLDETAALAKMLEDHEIVDSVTVNTASFGGTYTTHMVITLVSEGEAGGEQ